MDLEQLYYAGELLGLLAVIESLLYVGRQVRQNTASMVNSASTDYSNGLNALTISMVMDRDFAGFSHTFSPSFRDVVDRHMNRDRTDEARTGARVFDRR